jgi:hypothetical protein
VVLPVGLVLKQNRIKVRFGERRIVQYVWADNILYLQYGQFSEKKILVWKLGYEEILQIQHIQYTVQYRFHNTGFPSCTYMLINCTIILLYYCIYYVNLYVLLTRKLFVFSFIFLGDGGLVHRRALHSPISHTVVLKGTVLPD